MSRGLANASRMAGSVISGVPLSIMMATAGGAWENCKKSIEKGGGKRLDQYFRDEIFAGEEPELCLRILETSCRPEDC